MEFYSNEIPASTGQDHFGTCKSDDESRLSPESPVRLPTYPYTFGAGHRGTNRRIQARLQSADAGERLNTKCIPPERLIEATGCTGSFFMEGNINCTSINNTGPFEDSYDPGGTGHWNEPVSILRENHSLFDYDSTEVPFDPLPPFIKLMLIITEFHNIVLSYYASYWFQVMGIINFAIGSKVLVASAIFSVVMSIGFCSNSFGDLIKAMSRSKKKRMESRAKYFSKLTKWFKDPFAYDWFRRRNGFWTSQRLDSSDIVLTSDTSFPKEWDENKDFTISKGLIVRSLFFCFWAASLVMTCRVHHDSELNLFWPNDLWIFGKIILVSFIVPLILFLWRLACIQSLPIKFHLRTLFYNGKLTL